jgi:hypothetical protein
VCQRKARNANFLFSASFVCINHSMMFPTVSSAARSKVLRLLVWPPNFKTLHGGSNGLNELYPSASKADEEEDLDAESDPTNLKDMNSKYGYISMSAARPLYPCLTRPSSNPHTESQGECETCMHACFSRPPRVLVSEYGRVGRHCRKPKADSLASWLLTKCSKKFGVNANNLHNSCLNSGK